MERHYGDRRGDEDRHRRHDRDRHDFEERYERAFGRGDDRYAYQHEMRDDMEHGRSHRFNEEFDRDPYRERESRRARTADDSRSRYGGGRPGREEPRRLFGRESHSPEPYGQHPDDAHDWETGRGESGRGTAWRRQPGWSRDLPRDIDDDLERYAGFPQRDRSSGGRRWFPPDRGQEAYERGQPGMAAGGRFAGHGPKDYRRNDERVREDVCDRLTADAHVDAGGLIVLVRDGEVTLEGTVPDRHMKRRAETLADDVAGVRQVHNRLTVPHREAFAERAAPYERGGERGWRGWDPESAPERGRFARVGPQNYRRADERIREDVCDALTDDDVVDATALSVTVENGEVTLTGTVHDRTMKRRAEDVADDVRGVREVHNRVTLRPQTAPRPPSTESTAMH